MKTGSLYVGKNDDGGFCREECCVVLGNDFRYVMQDKLFYCNSSSIIESMQGVL